MPRNKRITVRLSDDEYKTIEDKVQLSYLSFSRYARKSMLDKPIVVIDGVRELTTELRRIGNNLNHLTRLANQDRLSVLELDGVEKGLENIWQSLNSLTRSTR